MATTQPTEPSVSAEEAERLRAALIAMIERIDLAGIARRTAAAEERVRLADNNICGTRCG
jgi:hypothetical protein